MAKLKLICSLLIFIILINTSASAWPRRGNAGVNAPVGGVLMNVFDASGGGGNNYLLNWWKIGTQLILVSSINGTLTGQQVWDCPASCSTPTTYLDTSTGELISPLPADVVSIERGFFTPVPYPQYQYANTSFNNFSGQIWNVTWTGCATPIMTAGGSLGSGGSPGVVSGSNSGTITLGTSGYVNVTAKFTMTAACFANPPRNIKVFQSQYATNVANGEMLNPDWVAAMKPAGSFAYLRFMDPMQTNFNSLNDFSQLADDTYQSLNKSFDMAVGFGSVSGSVLTLSTFSRGTAFKAGQRVVCIGCTNTATIASQATGTPGGAGTYNLTGAAGSAGANTIIMGIIPAGSNSAYGPKAGISPSIVCEIGNKTNNNVEYTIPIAASDTMVSDIANAFKVCLNTNLRVKFSYGNENWNNGFNTFNYVQAYASVSSGYSGYRAAQMMEIIAGVYGTDSYNPSAGNVTSRWEGAIGGHYATPATSAAYLAGAQAAIAASPSPLTLTQLFRSIDVAPYWGSFFGGSCINPVGNISAANPALVTINPSGCAGIAVTNGQVVRMFVTGGGTMDAVLNNQDFTVSGVSGNTFNINANTTGLSYVSNSTNGVMDAALFKLADQSIALNASTPLTYPTKFSYFTQQMSSAILNGSASDPSYGTLTVGDALNMTSVGMDTRFQQNALNAQANGLELAQYEAGPTTSLSGGAQGNLRPAQAIEFLNGWNFDQGVNGDAINTPRNLYNTMFQKFSAVNGIYPSQYNDIQFSSQFGPWGALRFIPGDTGNYRWQTILTRNAQGIWVDPTPAPTWTLSDTAGDINFGSAGATTLTCPLTVPADGLAVVGLGWTNSTSTISSVSISGGVGNMTQDASTVNTWSSAIYSKPVTAAGSPYTITITWGASAPFRNCKAVVLSNLASSTKRSASSGNPQKSTTIDVTKGAYVFATATLSGAITFASSSTQGSATGTVTQVDKQVPAGQAFGYAYWSPGPNFSSPIFGVATNAANSLAVATYK